MTQPVTIFGAGGHALEVFDVARESGFDVVGFVVERAFYDHNPNAYTWVHRARSGSVRCAEDGWTGATIVANGDPRTRKRLTETWYAPCRTFPTLIASSAIVSDRANVDLHGVYVARGAIVNSRAVVAAFAHVNTGAVVSHGVLVDAYAQVGPGAVLLGGCVIERLVEIGGGATILPRVRVGKGAIVGAGSVVTRNVPPGVVVRGDPARVRRKV